MPDIIYMLNIHSDCMQVLFVGEEAIDEGGPKWEFFRLLAKEVSATRFFGEEHSKFFQNDILALQVCFTTVCLFT